LHDDDPPEGSGGLEQDPLEGLVQPAVERVASEGASAAEALQQRAQLAEDRLAEVLDAYRKLKTENEGFKDRTKRNLERRFDQRRERLLLKFIEILDNLDRALEATEQTYTGTPMIEGIILVRTQLLSVLQEEGLERIPVLGLPYDPRVAEAVETRPVVEAEHDHLVVKELLRGYRLHGRVARAARVAVGQYQPEAEEEPAGGDLGLLVGADEAPSPEEPVPDGIQDAAAEDADTALQDLLAGSVEPNPPEPVPRPAHGPGPASAPAPRPTPALAKPTAAKPPQKNPTDSIEIDLLKEVLEDGD
jgi:molecular chaperone GrpE